MVKAKANSASGKVNTNIGLRSSHSWSITNNGTNNLKITVTITLECVGGKTTASDPYTLKPGESKSSNDNLLLNKVFSKTGNYLIQAATQISGGINEIDTDTSRLTVS